ncbi:MAG: TetR/AcrR family transcriptional regulator [Pseudomonadota bacterium]
MARRSDHTKEELHELIVSETMAMVESFGAPNITAREIAKRIGYTPGTLYTHFDNLAAILLFVKARILAQLREDVLAAIKEARDPQGRLLQMGYAYVAFAEVHPHWFALLFNDSPEADVAVPQDLSQTVDSLFDLVTRELAILNPRATEDELELGVRALWCGVHGICALSLGNRLVTQDWRADQQILKTLISHFLDSWAIAH